MIRITEISSLDIISSSLLTLALFLIIIYWQRFKLSRSTKTLFILLVVTIISFNFGNFLEWSNVMNLFVVYEDHIAILIPLFWMMFLYAFIQKATQNKIKRSEKKMSEAYERAELYKDLFAHDVKNIFQNILSANELLKYYLKNNQEEKRELLKIIEIMEDQVIRGKNLAQNVYKISNIGNNNKELTKIDVIKILENAINFTLNSFRERNINIEFDIPLKSYLINANDLLLDVFENILMNAIMHNDKEHIMIKVKVLGENTISNQNIRIEFFDNGPGIPNIMKKRIFERPIDLKEKKGIGLGLYLVKNIIDSFNGNIWVEDNDDAQFKGGSKFVIDLPII